MARARGVEIEPLDSRISLKPFELASGEPAGAQFCLVEHVIE